MKVTPWEHIAVKKCPVCGREYVPAPEHSYKVYLECKKGTGHYKTPVCSYGCMRKHQREKEEKKRARKCKN